MMIRMSPQLTLLIGVVGPVIALVVERDEPRVPPLQLADPAFDGRRHEASPSSLCTVIAS